MDDIPEILIWALLVAVIVQGFSMALLVYLMFRRQRRRSEKEVEVAKPSKEESPEEET